jgi:hypothetical protein
MKVSTWLPPPQKRMSLSERKLETKSKDNEKLLVFSFLLKIFAFREMGSSFEKFVKDVLEDIENEDLKSQSKSEKKPIGNEKKTGPRRGVWKRVKVRPADAFEAAETQNIGKQLYNSVIESDKVEGVKRVEEATTAKAIEITTTEAPLEHVFSETTTAEPEIEEKGMFDEARNSFVLVGRRFR